MSEVILKTTNLSKVYNKQKILDSINMNIKRGQIYGFIGQNGAGKTTLMRIVAGLAFQTSGTFTLMEKQDRGEIEKVRNKIGCMIEYPAYYGDLTAKQNLEVVRLARGITDKGAIDKVLKIVGLEDTDKKKVKRFSLGMRQRLGIAQTLIGNPEILILDEPTNGLDPNGMIEIRSLIKKLNVERGITILISSHLLSELHQVAECYGIIHRGRLLEEITAEQLEDSFEKHIRIKVDDYKLAEKLIKEKLKISKYEVTNDNVIKLFSGTDKPMEISNFLFKNNISIEEFSVVKEDIESYFIRRIGENR